MNVWKDEQSYLPKLQLSSLAADFPLNWPNLFDKNKKCSPLYQKKKFINLFIKKIQKKLIYEPSKDNGLSQNQRINSPK